MKLATLVSVAVVLPALLLLPRIASARKHPPQIIPEMANAKVVGVQCTVSVGPNPCDTVMAELRTALGLWFKFVPLVPKMNPAGLWIVDVGPSDFWIGIAIQTNYPPLSELTDTDVDIRYLTANIFLPSSPEKSIATIRESAKSNSADDYVYDAQPATPVGRLEDFIMLHSGRAAEACKSPTAYFKRRGMAFDNAGNVGVYDGLVLRRFERFCAKNGLP